MPGGREGAKIMSEFRGNCHAVLNVAFFFSKTSPIKRHNTFFVQLHDSLPGLKCHSWSPEEDTSATRTVTMVTGNSRRVGKAMTAATQLVTCPGTHRCPQAYLSEKKI